MQDDADLLMVTAGLDGLMHDDPHGREGGQRCVEPALRAVAVEAHHVGVVDVGRAERGVQVRCREPVLVQKKAGRRSTRDALEGPREHVRGEGVAVVGRPAPAHRERLEDGENDLVGVHRDVDPEGVVVDAARMVDVGRLGEVEAEP